MPKKPLTKKEVQDKKVLRLEIVDKMSTLATAGFGLVAALAWNSAIQDLFKQIFPDQQSLWAKFLYAIFITVLIVLLTTYLGKASNRLKEGLDPRKKNHQ